MNSDGEALSKAFRVLEVLMGHMEHRWIAAPYLRCVHIKDKGRRLMYVASERVRNIDKNINEWKETVTASLMVEQSSKDVISLNVV